MRVLADTHGVFWWAVEQESLSARAIEVLSDPSNEVHLSVASAWEIAIKVGIGKWPEARLL